MKKLLVLSSLIATLSFSPSESSGINHTIDLPGAQGMTTSKFIINEEAFVKMDVYFTSVNECKKAEIGYISEAECFNIQSAVEENAVAIPEMQDSCFAESNSGVKYVVMHHIVDCCGLYVYKKDLGVSACHVVRTSQLASLSSMLEPFKGQKDVVVTIVSSWKSRLLSQLVKHLKKQDLTPQIWTNPTIEQQNTTGTQLVRYLNPASLELSKQQLKQYGKIKSDKNKTVFLSSIIESKVSSPLSVALDMQTGLVFWPGQNRESAFMIANSISKLNQFPMCWAGQRYLTEIVPLIKAGAGAKENTVKVAFYHYPEKE